MYSEAVKSRTAEPVAVFKSEFRDSKRVEVCHACGSHEIADWLGGFVHHYREHGVDKLWEYCLKECQVCGLGFISPIPDLRLLQTFYQRDYHCYQASESFDPRNELRKYRIARYRFAGSISSSNSSKAFGKKCLAMATEWLSGKTISYSLGIPLQLPADANIFEMGYGSGYWLKMMSFLGYSNLHGFDIDASTVSRRELRNLGVSLSSGDFLKNDYPQDYFDCIRLEHVFEHLLSPREVLQKLSAMLKPQGNLVMTLPCKLSWSREISSRYWGPLEPPVHLFHHTPTSVTNLFKDLPLVMGRIKPYSVTSQLAGTIGCALKARGYTLPDKSSQVLNLVAPAYRTFGSVTGRGDFMTVWARKNG